MEQPSFLHHLIQAMKTLTPTQQEYLNVAELFLCASAQDFTAWFTGEWKRWKRTEYNLPRMEEKGALTAVRNGKKKVYSPAGYKEENLPHRLFCTISLLRFKTSVKEEVEFVGENFFRQLGTKSVPEWGMIKGYKMLLFEYSTADNFRRIRMMKQKVQGYKQSLQRFEDYFDAECSVLFVINAPKHKVKRFARNSNDFYFTDAKSFMAVTYGRQLTANIYIWGGDGKSYPLTNDVA